VGLCYNIIHDISEKGEENSDFILIRMWCLACDQKTIILSTLSDLYSGHTRKGEVIEDVFLLF
jgi:hypothetical protein